MKLRTKIITTYIILIVMAAGLLGFIAINASQETALKQEEEKIQFALQSLYTLVDMRQNLIQEQIKNNLNVSMKLLREEYGEVRVDEEHLVQIGEYTVPTLYAGDLNLIYDTVFVDELQDFFGGNASVFVLNGTEFVRVSTNLRHENGDRAIGTILDGDSTVYQSVVQKQVYYSRAWVINRWYITAYKPLVDVDNNVVGILRMGVPEIDEKLENIFANVKLGEAGKLYIMDSSGTLLYHPTRQGENIARYEYIQEIFDRKNGSMEFKVNNNTMLSRFQYFEPWDWHIVVLLDIHDIKSGTKGIINFIITIGLMIFVLAIAMIVNHKVNKIEGKIR